MKNVILFLFTVLLMLSCDDSQVNDFAMQANIDDRFYSSEEALGSIAEDGNLIIQGNTQLESLTLRLSDLAVGDYQIGEGFPNTAIFEDMNGNIYNTELNGTGVINISEIDNINKTLRGTFHFSAILPGIDTVYVSRGVLYNVYYDGMVDPANAGTFTAKVNNDPFVPTVLTATEADSSISILASTVLETIDITVPSNVEVGEYTLPENGYGLQFQDQSGVQPTATGTIIITEHNPTIRKIKGTFYFLTDQTAITDGSFEVTYR